jgi:hypothetical protein
MAYNVPVKDNQIAFEGFLKVRSDSGFAGMRPWIMRYFVLCKHDFTFRRYNGPEELETPGKKPPRVYKMSEIEYVAQDTPPRFLVGLKPRSVGGEGEKVKLAADVDSDMFKWVKAFTELHRIAPKDEDDDPIRRALEAKKKAAEAAAKPKGAASPSARDLGKGPGAASAGKPAAKPAAKKPVDEDDEDEGGGGGDEEDEDDAPPPPKKSPAGAKGGKAAAGTGLDDDDEDEKPAAKKPAAKGKAAAADDDEDEDEKPAAKKAAPAKGKKPVDDDGESLRSAGDAATLRRRASAERSEDV